MPQSKHIVFVAGEESGDQYASEIIHALKLDMPNVKISGIGGHHMASEGADMVYDLARYGVTGFTEVLRHLITIKKAFKAIKQHLKKTKPDLLVLIDYPGFNLRLAEFAKQVLGIRILYYISPQIWAWKAGRIKTIKRNIDHMVVILPFEKEIYKKAGVPVSFVGHPLVKRMDLISNDKDYRALLKLPKDKKLLAILPGSRTNEIQQHMPTIVKTLNALQPEIPNLHVVIPVAATLDSSIIENHLSKQPFSYSLINGQSNEVAKAADCVVVASGTASLECALLAKPMCIVYKASTLTYLIASKVIRVRYLGLSNLLVNKMLIPELLQYDFNSKELKTILQKSLLDKSYANQMTSQLDDLKTSLSAHKADESLLGLVKKELGCS